MDPSFDIVELLSLNRFKNSLDAILAITNKTEYPRNQPEHILGLK
jgi:hypothetical protein